MPERPADLPYHEVNIARPFGVGKFHVTVDQFKTFVAETGYDAAATCAPTSDTRNGNSWRDPGFPQNGSHPVVCVSWYDAKAFVGWMAKKTGKAYRLLSDAEWEHAARAGTATSFSFGNDPRELCRHGNGKKDEDAAIACDDGYVYTSPVGSFAPNGFGLHDVHGNARQWVEDCYNRLYNGAPSDGSVWTSGDCTFRVLRGGAWNGSPANLRSYRRFYDNADYRKKDVGFRVARTLAP